MARDLTRTLIWRPNEEERRGGSRQRDYYYREYPTQGYQTYRQPYQQPYHPYRRGGPQRPRPQRRFNEFNKPLRIIPQEEFLRLKAEGYGRFYIDKQIRRKTPMVFVTYDGVLRGLILRRMSYNLDLLANGEKIRINKLDIKYCYKQSHEPRILPYIQIDEEVKALGLGPEMDPSRRYQIDDRVLIQCYRERRPIVLVLRGGEVFGGVIDWFSKYEVKIELPSRRCVVCFRHAAYSLGVAAY